MFKHPKLFVLLKWIVLIAAYTFLAYKLLTFEHYADVLSSWKIGWTTHLTYFIIVLILLPLNWLLETYKWKFLVRRLEILSLKEAFKSVMIGNTTAFFTPNRLGEFPGRAISLSNGNKLQGITIGVLGSLSQTLTIMLIGIPSALLLLIFYNSYYYNLLTYLILLALFFSILLLYFFIPRLCNFLKSLKIFYRIEHLLESLTKYTVVDLAGTLLLSILRYFVFCTQLFFLMGFFGVELHPLFGALAIASYYLFVTFAPSLAFSEGAVRASIALLVFGVFSANVVGIAAAGLFIWLINFVVPMLIGSLILGKKNPQPPKGGF